MDVSVIVGVGDGPVATCVFWVIIPMLAIASIPDNTIRLMAAMVEYFFLSIVY